MIFVRIASKSIQFFIFESFIFIELMKKQGLVGSFQHFICELFCGK